MATNKRWDGASFVDLTVQKRWDGASWVDLTIAKRWDGATWVDFFSGGGSGLSATASPGSASGELFDPEPAPLFATVTSNSVTVTPTGGTAPYTYAWTHLSGSSSVLVTSPTSATTTFSGNIPKNQERLAVKRCTVTDSLLATATVDVSVSLLYATDI